MGRRVLKKARKEKGMTQQAVADYLNISLRYYQSIEAGDFNGSIEIWDRLEDLLAVNQRQLREIVNIRLGQVSNL